jgi:hypothetical protein
MPAPVQQGEDTRTEAMNVDCDTPLGARCRWGSKWPHAGEAELGSGDPTSKRPRMVVSRLVEDLFVLSCLAILC